MNLTRAIERCATLLHLQTAALAAAREAAAQGDKTLLALCLHEASLASASCASTLIKATEAAMEPSPPKISAGGLH